MTATPLQFALAYAQLGWHVLPVRPRDKRPLNGNGIDHATTNADRLREWFAKTPDANIGIRLDKSGLFALDFDPRNGADLAECDELPRTLTAVTGGGGRHLVYRAPPGAKLPGALHKGVDVKHRGYIVVEPSRHPGGGAYAWQDWSVLEDGVPTIAAVDAQALFGGGQAGGEAPARPPRRDTDAGAVREGGRNAYLSREAFRLRKAGHSVDQLFAVLQAINAATCAPPLPEAEVRSIAERKRRVAADPGAGDHAAPDGGSGYADFADPVAAAASIVAVDYRRQGVRVLHYWQGDFHLWTGAHYEVLPLPDVREKLYRIGPQCSRRTIKKATIDNVQDALRAAANLSEREVPTSPAWIAPRADDPDARAVIPLTNGILRVDDGELLPLSPRLFAAYRLPFNYRREVDPPLAWLTFVGGVWHGDLESVQCLQEWLGLLLTADTSFQKALLVVGPPRSGKGVILRVIARLVGDTNIASPSLASLGMQFGLQPLIGKTVALVSDARLGGRADIAAIAENVLRLTGEDSISVDRKFQTSYTARLTARLVMASNELPVFRDAAAALPSRFIVLRTTRSHLGEEDHDLERRLADELPGILAWALAGLRRLRKRGRFVQPASAGGALRVMEDLASPIRAFLREECAVEVGGTVPVRELYEKWRQWCADHGRDQPGTEQTFGRDIAAAVPAVAVRRLREQSGGRYRAYDGVRLKTAAERIAGDAEGGQDDLPI